jgi:Mn-containing catalase
MERLADKVREISEVLSDQPTQDMIDFFEKRTKEHIERVNKNIRKVVQKYPEYDLPYDHDASKFSEEERLPYIWLTEYFRRNKKLEYPKGVEKKIEEAVQHHYKNNEHHQENHRSPSKMSKKSILEMVCDWGAMSQEKGGSLREWVKTHTSGFTKEQKDFIDEVVDLISSSNNTVHQ